MSGEALPVPRAIEIAPTRAILAIQLGPARLGLDAGTVAEVLGVRPWVAVPGAPPGLPGVLAWRGRAVAVLDLCAVMGIARALVPGENRARAVLLEAKPGMLALPVDAVSAVQEVEGHKVRPAHAAQHPLVLEEVELAGALVSLVDLAALVRRVFGKDAP